jgi:hypothetical protein
MAGLITGRGEGNNWGRVTVRTDGSILLENVTLWNIDIRNCELIAESGEYPIPFADRMNTLMDFAAAGASPEYRLNAGHTHKHDGDPTQTPCKLCGLRRQP